jgi:hypothetical protein
LIIITKNKTQGGRVMPPTNNMKNVTVKPEVRVDEETGEVQFTNIKYLLGMPKQYRYNAQSGQFNIDGKEPVLDEKGRVATEFKLLPLSFRVFRDSLFGRDKMEEWAEMFFIDSLGCVSAIMLNNTNVQELKQHIKSLFYEGLSITDSILVLRPRKIENGDKKWFICEMEHEDADAELIRAQRNYLESNHVYRADTLNSSAVYEGLALVSGSFFTSLVNEKKVREHEQVLELSEHL